MIPLLYNHEAKFPIFNNNTVLLLPFSLHACCHFYCIIVAILYVSLLADFTVFVLSDYKRIEQKIFHCEIVVDNEKVKRETARYVKLPQIIDFTDKDGNDRMQEEIQANYDRIRQEVRQIVEDEITRIKNDPELCHLIKEEE